MADNFDFKKYLAENKLGPFSKVKQLNEDEHKLGYGERIFSGWDIEHSFRPVAQSRRGGIEVGDEFTPEEMGMTMTSRHGSKEGSTYVVQKRLDNGMYLCKLKSEVDKLSEEETQTNEALQLQPKNYYQILDSGMNEWHDDFQYIGQIGGGSSVGEIGEHMFMAAESPGVFTFVAIGNDDIDTMVKPSMSEGIDENSYRMAKNPDVKAKVDKIISLLIDIDVDRETMEYILGAVGMDNQMTN